MSKNFCRTIFNNRLTEFMFEFILSRAYPTGFGYAVVRKLQVEYEKYGYLRGSQYDALEKSYDSFKAFLKLEEEHTSW